MIEAKDHSSAFSSLHFSLSHESQEVVILVEHQAAQVRALGGS